jgi:putative CocE/NonD family hydrolase
MRSFHVPSQLAFIAAWALVGQLPAVAEDEKEKIVTLRDVMVPMRDGVKLATDVYLPSEAAGSTSALKLPAILTRTPYSKGGNRSLGLYFAARGYAFVAQDTRGRYLSEGVWHWMTDDGPDGLDTAQWLLAQKWSNGRFGMIGGSYVGGTQHAMAMVQAPGLVTVIPLDAVANMGYHGMRNGGAFELRFWNWIHAIAASRGSRQTRDPGTAAVLAELRDNRRAYLMNLPLRRGCTPLKLAPEYEDWLVQAMRHGANDDFWKQNSIIDYPGLYKDIPVYLVGGWYDSWGASTTGSYMALSKTLKSPIYLIMGPWTHGGQGRSSHGQVDFGPEAAIRDLLAWRQTWYDHWLKGLDNDVGKSGIFATRVRIFVMGSGDGHKTPEGHLFHGGSWREEREWPLARTQYTAFYFRPGGGLSSQKSGEESASTSFEFDPRQPVPTIGGNISSGDGILIPGGWDQRGGKHIWNAPEPVPLSARNDVLVFQSEPLAEDLEVTGEIAVRLWISSSATDTDFTAKLIDVYPASRDFPGGFDLNIGDGILRARFRDSLKMEKLMVPGRVYPLTIKIYPTSNVFKKGHRIRIDVSSSSFPRFDVNPNTGEPLGDQRRCLTAVNTVYHDRQHPSHILLPVIPAINPARK